MVLLLAWSLPFVFMGGSVFGFDALFAAVAAAFVFGTWIVVLIPLYLFVPLRSSFWRWPKCTICGAVSGAAIMVVIGNGMEPQILFVYAGLAAMAGGVTCLFASLTRYRFQCEKGP
jgi:hypothetical protein